MTVPICPIHNTPTREGRGGSHYCPKKNADGTWCSYKVPAPKTTAAPTTANGGITIPGSGDYRLEALKGACQVYEGTGSPDAMDFARAALVFLKGEA
jgi:hypothetical protein